MLRLGAERPRNAEAHVEFANAGARFEGTKVETLVEPRHSARRESCDSRGRGNHVDCGNHIFSVGDRTVTTRLLPPAEPIRVAGHHRSLGRTAGHGFAEVPSTRQSRSAIERSSHCFQCRKSKVERATARLSNACSIRCGGWIRVSPEDQPHARISGCRVVSINRDD